MPSLVAFGRKWNISSDDFVFPELTEAFIRMGWIVVVLAIVSLQHPLKCNSLEWKMCMIVMMTINIISFIFCIIIALLSSKGSILDVTTRKHVVTLIYFRLPLFFIEFCWIIASTILVFKSSQLNFCIRGIQIAVVLEWILLLSVLLGIILVFNPYGHNMDDLIISKHRSWKQRFNLCKIFQDNEMQQALDDIALLMASFFGENDFVASDIVAGLLLFVHSPNMLILSVNDYQKNQLNNISWMQVPQCIPTVSRMFDIAAAIYGWPTYLLNNFSCISCFKLCKKSVFQKTKKPLIVDGYCLCHTNAFLLDIDCNEIDLLMVSFQNRLYQVPFFVMTDHLTKSIVIAIRGSASLSDLVTDFSLVEDLFTIDVDKDPVLREDKLLDIEGEVRVHRGMYKAARYVYDKLKENNLLEETIKRNPTYNLVICGHSLGGGIASLLTLLLKNTYPDVRCYAFSPPGCVISKHGIAETEQHVFSIFVGDDVIPRISIQSLFNLKLNIEREIFSTNRAKYEILIKGIYKLFFSVSWKLHDSELNIGRSFTYDRRHLIENHESYGTQDVIIENDISNASFSNLSFISLWSNRVKLYPPGQLLCIRLDTNNKVKMNWVNVDYLSVIQLTNNMFTDHWPKKVRKVLRQAKTEYVDIL